MVSKKKPLEAHVIHDSCTNCRHWHRLDDSDQVPKADVVGECRRYPPSVIEIDEGTEAPIQALPEVEARFCCGEHGRAIN